MYNFIAVDRWVNLICRLISCGVLGIDINTICYITIRVDIKQIKKFQKIKKLNANMVPLFFFNADMVPLFLKKYTIVKYFKFLDKP